MKSIVDRRTLLKTGGLAAIGSLTLGTSACGDKVSFAVSTVIGSLEALSPLLPNASNLISKGISLAKQFDKAYSEGKFTDATALFTNLGEIAQQIVEVAGLNNPRIMQILALGRVGLNVIASILKAQVSDPMVAAAVKGRLSASAEAGRQRAMIEKMADEKMIEMIVADLRR